MDTSINERFEKENNCKVVYENYTSNEEMYLKLKNGNSSYDVIFPSDYMIEKMISEDMLEEIDHANIPNIKNINEDLLNKEFDVDNKHSVPYFWGTVGIIYNKTMVKEPVDSWDILWDTQYKDQILMYDSQRDSLAVAFKKNGYSLNSTDLDELEVAKKSLVEQKPLVLAYVTDNVIDMMIGEEAALAVVYSGDANYCMNENENLEYVVPKEGSNIWFDNVAIPTTTQNKALAQKYINFLCQDDISLLNTEEVGYITPNKNLIEQLQKADWTNPSAYFPPKEVQDRCEIFRDPKDFLDNYANAWEFVRTNE